MDAQDKHDSPRIDGKIGRIADQTRGLMEDIKTWIDLKLQLVEIQITDRIEAVANRVAVGATLALLAFLTLLFFLVTAGLALGEWFGRASLGFLAVAGALALITLIVYLARPRFVRMSGNEAKRNTSSIEPPVAVPQLPPGTDSTDSSNAATSTS